MTELKIQPRACECQSWSSLILQTAPKLRKQHTRGVTREGKTILSHLVGSLNLFVECFLCPFSEYMCRTKFLEHKVLGKQSAPSQQSGLQTFGTVQVQHNSVLNALFNTLQHVQVTAHPAFASPSAEVLEQNGVHWRNWNKALEERSKLEQQREQFTEFRCLDPKGEFKAALGAWTF